MSRWYPSAWSPAAPLEMPCCHRQQRPLGCMVWFTPLQRPPALSAPWQMHAGWLCPAATSCHARSMYGVQHLLIVASDGTPYLLNRAGALFSYSLVGPDAAAGPLYLPPGTVLDGELVWVRSKGSGGPVHGATKPTSPPGSNSAAASNEATSTEPTTTSSSGSSHGLFVVSDALCIGGTRMWQLPLQQRLQQMVAQLGFTETEYGQLRATLGLAAAAATAAAAAVAAAAGAARTPAAAPAHGMTSYPAYQPILPRALPKKQQATPMGEDSVTLVFKRHLPVSAQVLADFESSRPSCPFPSDGLIFTPAAMPYVLGMQELMLQWQAPGQVTADITGTVLQERGRIDLYLGRDDTTVATFENLVPELVYKCVLSSPPATPPTAKTRPEFATSPGLPAATPTATVDDAQLQQQLQLPWEPVSVCWDQAVGSGDADALVHRLVVGGQWVSHTQLVDAVRQTQDRSCAADTDIDASAAATHPTAPTRGRVHPARTMPFAELYAGLLHTVAEGSVERWVDAGSGLEVFSHKVASGGATPR